MNNSGNLNWKRTVLQAPSEIWSFDPEGQAASGSQAGLFVCADRTQRVRSLPTHEPRSDVCQPHADLYSVGFVEVSLNMATTPPIA